jgi:hypothetical protein
MPPLGAWYLMPAVQGSRHYHTFRDLTQAALKYSLPQLGLPHAAQAH